MKIGIVFIGLWCNGNTTVFGAVVSSSNLGGPTEQKLLYKSQWKSCPVSVGMSAGSSPVGVAKISIIKIAKM